MRQVWKVPTDVVSYEEAAAMGGISLSTVAHAFYHRMKLPSPWAPAQEPIPVSYSCHLPTRTDILCAQDSGLGRRYFSRYLRDQTRQAVWATGCYVSPAPCVK